MLLYSDVMSNLDSNLFLNTIRKK